MGLLLNHWKKASFAGLAVFTAWSLATDTGARTCAVVLDVREVEALCGEDYPAPDFWERFKTMGGAGAVLSAESVADRLRAGDAIGYSKEEIEKLKATKVAAKGAPLTPGSLWIRKDGFAARLKDAARAHGFKLLLETFEDQQVAVLPEGRRPEAVSAGFDPERLALLKKTGLMPILRAATLPELILSGGEGAVSLIAGEVGVLPEGKFEALLARGHWAAFSDALGRGARARLYRSAGDRRERLLGLGEAGLSGGEAAFLREASKNALVRARLDAGGGVEGNLAVLRACLKALRRAGYAPALGETAAAGRPGTRAEWPVRFALGFFLAAAGPIFAMRTAVSVVRGMKSAGRLPEASPFREAFSGAAAALLVSVLFSAAVYALFSAAVWRLGATRLYLGQWPAAAVFLLSWAALYEADPRALAGLFKRGLGRASELQAAVPVALTAALFLLPQQFDGPGPRVWFDALSGLYPGAWWVGERWREWLVGYPCLFTGLCILSSRLEAESETGRDPRGWLLLGMFAPVGLACSAAAARLPFFVLTQQTLLGAAAGVLLGPAYLGARHLLLKKAGLRG